MAAPLFRAFIDRADRHVVEGWARDEADPFTAVKLTLFRDGVQVTHLLAETWRADLVEPGHSDGCCGFRYIWMPPLPDDDLSRIEVRLPDGKHIRGSPVFVPTPSDDKTVLGLQGAIDILDHERLAGWVRDEDRPWRAVGLAVLCDGREIAYVKANAFRRDLRDAGLGNGRYGFEYPFITPPDPLDAHTIEIRPDTGGPFPEGAKVLPAVKNFWDLSAFRLVSRDIAGIREPEPVRQAATALSHWLDILRKNDAEHTLGIAVRRETRRLLRHSGEGVALPRKQALVIDDQCPDARRDAASVALLSHMTALIASGMTVFFAPSLDSGSRDDALATLSRAGIHVLRPPLWPSIESIIRHGGEAFDLIYLHRLGNASAYLELAKRFCPTARIMWSIADIDSLRLQRQAKSEHRPELTLLSAQSEARERMAAWRSNVVLTHSDLETHRIKAAVPSCTAVTVRWAVPVHQAAYRPQERTRIVFLGHFGHAPNRDAIRWMATEIVPALRRRHPALDITVYGSGLTAETAAFACEGLHVVGYEPDIDIIFRQTRLMVAPLRFGAGIKGKVLESWAQGVPVLMTSIAAEGLPLNAGQAPCVVPEDAEQFAARVLTLWNDTMGLEQQSAFGYSVLRTFFSADAIAAQMKQALDAAFREKGMKVTAT